MIGAKIKKARLRRSLSLRQAAAASGLSPAGLSLIEQGKRHPTLLTLEKLAPVLHVRFTITRRGVVMENLR